MSRVELPNPPQSKAGWIIDYDKSLELLDYLAIKLPVVIYFRNFKMNEETGLMTYGTHDPYVDHHKIFVHTKVNDDEFMNTTLLHELVHAIQSEEWAARTKKPIFTFHREYSAKAGRGTQRYWGNEYERQARAWSEQLASQREPIIYYKED